MASFTVRLITERSAFGDSAGPRNAEVARILRRLADEVVYGEANNGAQVQLYDANGNRVGSAYFTRLDNAE